MKNMQIAGTGNSRFMKSAISETATWEEFRAMLRAGTFTFDFNGINEAGITEKGTPYNVDSVLKDATAVLLGGDSSMVPDEAFVALVNLIKNLDAVSVGAARVVSGSYTGTGAKEKTLTADFDIKFAFVGRREYDTIYGSFVKNRTRVQAQIGASATESVEAAWGASSLTIGNENSKATVYLNISGATYDYVLIG